MKIIGITGRARSGKDTIAQMILEEMKGKAWKLAFADPIKTTLKEFFDWDERHVNGDLKEIGDPRYGMLTPRHAMQQLGTNFGRACYPDIWVQIALRRIASAAAGPDTKLAVVSDVRFVNEARAIRKAGGAIWRVTGGKAAPLVAGAAAHPSETEMGSDAMLEQVDATIDNLGTLDQLRALVQEVLRKQMETWKET